MTNKCSGENTLKELWEKGEVMMKALSWSPKQAPDWDAFKSLFHNNALLTPAARPSAPISVESFIQRMTAQRDSGALVNFTEIQLAQETHIFGNIATVFQVYRTIVNGGNPGHGISAMTWIHDQEQWSCISMAWDAASEGKEIPSKYLHC